MSLLIKYFQLLNMFVMKRVQSRDGGGLREAGLAVDLEFSGSLEHLLKAGVAG